MGFREFLFLRQSACLRYQVYSLWVQLLASVPRISYRDKSLIILIFHFALCERNILTLAFNFPFRDRPPGTHERSINLWFLLRRMVEVLNAIARSGRIGNALRGGHIFSQTSFPLTDFLTLRENLLHFCKTD